MPKKIKLNIGVEADFDVIGISSAVKDYQLAFRLNSALHIDLKRIEDFRFSPGTNNNEISFSIYLHQFPETESLLCLLQNRNTEGFLMPPFRQADYFLIIQNPLNPFVLSEYISKIKPATKINAAFPINMSGTKMYQAFAQDLELHLMENSKK